MAAAADDRDAIEQQARKPAGKRLASREKAQNTLGPGQGLPSHVYEKVKHAIYLSHGKSIIAATMEQKLNECHTALQLQKFLIRWGSQFSKLAIMGVRLEMQIIGHGGGKKVGQIIEESEHRLDSSYAKGFKEAMVKHEAIAKSVREEQAARNARFHAEWAAIMRNLDEQEAALEDEDDAPITKKRARVRTKVRLKAKMQAAGSVATDLRVLKAKTEQRDGVGKTKGKAARARTKSLSESSNIICATPALRCCGRCRILFWPSILNTRFPAQPSLAWMHSIHHLGRGGTDTAIG